MSGTAGWVRRVTALLAAALLPAASALAEDVVVRRNVTVRAEPDRRSEVVDFPSVGERLDLLDDGAQRRGYYHVRLADGRRGWVYRTFVARVPDAQVATADPLVASDDHVSGMSAHFIDVDQGSAALLEFPCGAVMIDAGGREAGDGDHLVSYLDGVFARRPDLSRRLAAVFVTHTHIDHNRSLRRVAERFPVGGYIHNGLPNGSGRVAARWMLDRSRTASPPFTALAVDAALMGEGRGGYADGTVDPVVCTGVDPRIRVLSGGWAGNPGWPDGEFDNGNNHSLVIRVDFGASSFLFMGDLEEAGIETLLDRYSGTGLLDADVIVVGHHGSHNGTTAALLAAVTPRIAFISMGRQIQAPWTAWAYGHPRRTVVDMLVAAVTDLRPAPAQVSVADAIRRFRPYPMSRAVYATGWDGDVVVSADGRGRLDVRFGRPPATPPTAGDRAIGRTSSAVPPVPERGQRP